MGAYVRSVGEGGAVWDEWVIRNVFHCEACLGEKVNGLERVLGGGSFMTIMAKVA